LAAHPTWRRPNWHKCLLIPVGICGALAASAVVVDRVPMLRHVVVAPLSRVAEAAGFTLHQVSLSGLRFTSDAAVFEALDLPSARTLLAFDPHRARARIEALPWVAHARIDRVFPDGLVVRVVERQPLAVWRNGTRNYVIDRNGRRLAIVTADAMPGLPRITGPGAEITAARLFAGLSRHPDLQQRLQLAERRNAERWTLHLARGVTLHLPPGDEAEALERASALVSAGLAERGEIDLRVGGRNLPRAEAKPGPGRS
jgi:cell division protein FtsQ